MAAAATSQGVPGADTAGDHDEGTSRKLQGKRQYIHDAIVLTLMAMLRQCGFRDVVGDVGGGRTWLEAYCPRSWIGC